MHIANAQIGLSLSVGFNPLVCQVFSSDAEFDVTITASLFKK
jgi:hypothetical protein